MKLLDLTPVEFLKKLKKTSTINDWKKITSTCISDELYLKHPDIYEAIVDRFTEWLAENTTEKFWKLDDCEDADLMLDLVIDLTSVSHEDSANAFGVLHSEIESKGAIPRLLKHPRVLSDSKAAAAVFSKISYEHYMDIMTNASYENIRKTHLNSWLEQLPSLVKGMFCTDTYLGMYLMDKWLRDKLTLHIFVETNLFQRIHTLSTHAEEALSYLRTLELKYKDVLLKPSQWSFYTELSTIEKLVDLGPARTDRLNGFLKTCELLERIPSFEEWQAQARGIDIENQTLPEIGNDL